MALAISRTRHRSRVPLLDRALGTSRRRRQAAYLAFGTAVALLRPTLRRLALALTWALVVLSAAVLWLLLRT